MTTPRVTEIPQQLEPVIDDPFIDALDALRHRSRGQDAEPPAPRRAIATGAWSSAAAARRRSRLAAAAA